VQRLHSCSLVFHFYSCPTQAFGDDQMHQPHSSDAEHEPTFVNNDHCRGAYFTLFADSYETLQEGE
jgi:hypothetical protein